MSLSLHITETDDIIVPAALFSSGLTAQEIGTLMFFQALSQGVVAFDDETLAPLEMNAAIESLRAKGVIDATMQGNKLSIVVDLEKLEEGI